MAGHYAYKAYMQAKVQLEADPRRLILLLYEGALEHLALAKEGIEEHHAVKRGEHLSRAVAIISELYTALDPTVNDESIDFLRGLYQAMLVELAKVAVTHDVQAVQLAFRYIERLKQIWEQDVMGLKPHAASEETEPVAAMAVATPVAPPRPQAYGVGIGYGQRTYSV